MPRSIGILSLHLSLVAATSNGYRAAYVEHQTWSPCGQGSCGKEQNAASVQAYDAYAEAAALRGAQIIVFPEYGITGFSSYPKSTWISENYAEMIPPVSRVPVSVPCDSPKYFSATPSTVSLSCTARRHGIAVVANLMEYTRDGHMYNTDIVFDTTGAFLAKYRKLNLWGEGNVDVPPHCPESTFTTSFNVTFGVFTCADLIYKFPASDLVANGVRNFVVPVAWSNEMAQMQVMAYAQGWSLRHRVNLIVSNRKTTGESGSGIWASGWPLAFGYAPGRGQGRVTVAEVPDSIVGSSVLLAQPFSSTFPQFRLDLVSNGKHWAFAELSQQRVCSGSICCAVSERTGGDEGYVLAALDGPDSDEGSIHWPAKICAVIPCRRPGFPCLKYQPAAGDLTTVTIRMSGVRSTLVVPEVLVTGSSQQSLLEPGGGPDSLTFSSSEESAVLTARTTQAVLSAVVYGRSFADDRLPYTCPPQTPVILSV